MATVSSGILEKCSCSHFCLGLSVATRGDRWPKAGRTSRSRLRTAPALGLPTRRSLCRKSSLLAQPLRPQSPLRGQLGASPRRAHVTAPPPSWLASSAPPPPPPLHPPPGASCLLEPGPPGSAVVSPQLAGCIPPPRPGRHGNRPVNPHPLHCPSNSFATRYQRTLQEDPPFRDQKMNNLKLWEVALHFVRTLESYEET
ncbi:WAS/WASL-interacting protein family member 3-like [Pongo abelii]|uniref:WAS/WASL-interacting protein family member 3-like n=1 Tax=Pongo abelii TaxID=9601 RepID=UPI003006C4AC